MSKTVTLNKEAIAAAIVEEFANALAATLGGTATTAAPAAGTAGWLVTLPVSGGASGAVTIGCDAEGATNAAKTALMMDEVPDAASVADLVKEIAGQAAGSLVLRTPFEPLKFGPASIAEAAAGAWAPTTTIQVGDIRCLVGAVATVTIAAART